MTVRPVRMMRVVRVVRGVRMMRVVAMRSMWMVWMVRMVRVMRVMAVRPVNIVQDTAEEAEKEARLVHGLRLSKARQRPKDVPMAVWVVAVRVMPMGIMPVLHPPRVAGLKHAPHVPDQPTGWAYFRVACSPPPHLVVPRVAVVLPFHCSLREKPSIFTHFLCITEQLIKHVLAALYF